MIILDTNVLYLISGENNNSEINKVAFLNYLKDKDIVICLTSVFEILNNQYECNQYSQIINKVAQSCRSLYFAINTYEDKFIAPYDLINLEQKDLFYQKTIRNKIGKYISHIFSFFYSNLLSHVVCAYFISFQHFKDYSTDNYAESIFMENIQLMANIIEGKIRVFFEKHLYEMIMNDAFSEKNRNHILNKIITEILASYVPTYNNSYERLDNGTFSYKHLYQRIISVSKKIDCDDLFKKKREIKFWDVCLFKSFTELSGFSLKRIQNYIKKMVDQMCLHEDLLFQGYLHDVFKKSLVKILEEGPVLTSNDFLDCLLLNDCNNFKPATVFITFDNKFASKSYPHCFKKILSTKDFK